MESADEKIKRLEFQQSLLLNMIGQTQYPFFQLVIQNKLTEDEMNEILSLSEEIYSKYEKLKEEGFVHFTFLLTHFVGMLNPKLDPLDVAEAMQKQKLFAPLMNEFIRVLSEERL
jgi:hypothetical protein